jgi:peptidoglycan/LPS O-acetylase OafA/YrhL
MNAASVATVRAARVERLSTVEGLRGFAMSLVFFGHFASIFDGYVDATSPSAKVLAYFAVWGHQGIAFFFVITGYFVYRKFLEERVSYPEFVKRRLLRICPIYWSVLVVYLGLAMIFPGESKLPHGTLNEVVFILKNFLLLQGFTNRPIITVSWAITYLVLAYTLLPLLVMGLRMKRWSQSNRILGIISGVFLWLALCHYWKFLSPRLVVIAVGMLIHEALSRKTFTNPFFRQREGTAVVVWIFSLTVWYVANQRMWELFPETFFPGFYHYLFLYCGLFYICMYSLAYDGILRRFLSTSILKLLGEISYCFYLLHGVTLKAAELVLRAILPPAYHLSFLFWGMVLICYASSFCVAWLFFTIIERPLARVYQGKYIIGVQAASWSS